MRNPLPSNLPHPAVFRLFSRPILILIALALVVAACGGSEEVEAGAAPGDETGQDLPADSDEPSTEEPSTDEPAGEVDAGDYQQTDAQPDMISGQPAPIEEVRVVDDQTIGVRYENGSEPCSLADVTVTESDTEITVALQTGLHPNAAAMSCVAQVLGYEIQVGLDAPVGDRTITAVEA